MLGEYYLILTYASIIGFYVSHPASEESQIFPKNKNEAVKS